MEHRKRSMMQHKVEISTLLRIAIANNKNLKLNGNKKLDADVAKTLAVEAIESLKNCDHSTAAKVENGQVVWM